MNTPLAIGAILLVATATLLIGIHGLRISRTTSDFYVASRTVQPWWNASAIGGEYLSAASFLGVAGLVFLNGRDALWYPVGYTAGYLMLLLFVAAPLRRSGAYTVPDFVQARLGSVPARRLTSLLVVLVGCLYIIPQLHGAALTVSTMTGLPSWAGSGTVAVVVTLAVVAGGMRSMTFVQAFQFWLKLGALAVPLLFLLFSLPGLRPAAAPLTVGGAAATGALGTYQNVSLFLALLLGTLGLPHVLVRFYTNPDGPTARKTTVLVLGLLSAFYLLPVAFGYLARVYAPAAVGGAQPDAVVLLLPHALIPGALGDLLTALVVAGAFAAFLSTTSGLVVSVAGVLSQDALGGGVKGFRRAAVLAMLVPFLLSVPTQSPALAGSVGQVFAFTASTLCPVLVLGIWWPRLSTAGAVAGMVSGGVGCGTAMIATAALGTTAPVWLSQPAAWSVPLTFAVMIGVSWRTPRSVPADAWRILARLHAPERR